MLPLLALVQRMIWKERHQFFINCNDVRDAVVDTVLVAKAAAALQGTSSSVHSGPWEAQHKVQPVQFSSKGRPVRQRLLSEGVWRRSCRKSLARMVWMCMP